MDNYFLSLPGTSSGRFKKIILHHCVEEDFIEVGGGVEPPYTVLQTAT
jgi:hypothetical protein